MTNLFSTVNEALWGIPGVIILLGVGLYLSVRLGAVQLLLPRAFQLLLRKLRSKPDAGVSPVQALCTALAATVGTGNLVGVAGAICLGGPGAVFWIWICGLLGMATKYTEAALAVRFRKKGKDGYLAGPMYMMTVGLGERFRPLACVYALFGVIASFGVGCAAQINSAVTGINSMIVRFGGTPGRRFDLLIGLMLAAVLAVLFCGGAKRIGQAAQLLVPAAAAGYLLMCAAVLVLHAKAVPDAIVSIFLGAFSPKAVTGGMIGSAFQTLRVGCSRGVFTNEAGMGTASIAHGGAEGVHPAQQGMLGLLEVFLDTIVICTFTALAILVSGVPIDYGVDAGAALTSNAFCAVLGDWASAAVGIALVLFAGATVLGWGLYGARCLEFLCGSGSWKWFVLFQFFVIVISAVADTGPVWQFSETVNALMAFPNLLALVLLSAEAARITKEYKKSGGATASGGNYADFHQCKPLRTVSYEKVPPSGYGSQERGQKNLSSEHRSA